MSRILVVVKDPGGTRAVLKVVDKLKQMGEKIIMAADGSAVKLLSDRQIPFLSFGTGATRVLIEAQPDIILSSMCSGGGLGRDLIALGKDEGVVTVCLQDFWGARLRVEFGDEKYWPDYILVPDEVSKRIVFECWGGYRLEQVIVTGQPVYDNLANLDIEKIKSETFAKLNIGNDLPLVFFTGQIEETGKTLEYLVDALNDLDRRVYLAPRWHYRISSAPEELNRCQEALKKFRGRIVDTNLAPYDAKLEFDPLVAAADIVTGMFATNLVEAAYLQKEVISIMFPDAGSKEWGRLTGLVQFPLVELGCCANAKDIRSLQESLEDALTIGLRLKNVQQQHLKLDGKNAFRAADFLRNLTKGV